MGSRHQDLDALDRRSPGHEAPPPDTVGYWSERDEWVAVGKRVADLRDRAKREGVPLESLPGARSLIESFKALGRRLDRRTR